VEKDFVVGKLTKELETAKRRLAETEAECQSLRKPARMLRLALILNPRHSEPG